MKFNTALVITSLVSSVYGHSRLSYPPPRSDGSGLKTGPCGDVPPGAAGRTALTPGPVTIALEETITHTGAPWRLAIADTSGGDAALATPCVLLDHIPHPGTGARPADNIFRITVNIPDVNCPTCTLQLLSVMTDKISDPSCAYDPGNTAAPAPNCFSNYHSCADISIAGTGTLGQCEQPATWPFRQGPMDTAGAPIQAQPLTYFKSEVSQWCPDGYLKTAPADFRVATGPGSVYGGVTAPAQPGVCEASNPGTGATPGTGGTPGGTNPGGTNPGGTTGNTGGVAGESDDMILYIAGGAAGLVALGVGYTVMNRKKSNSDSIAMAIPLPPAPSGGGGGLPPGWKQASDPTTGKTYYYNKAGQTSWSKPM